MNYPARFELMHGPYDGYEVLAISPIVSVVGVADLSAATWESWLSPTDVKYGPKEATLCVNQCCLLTYGPCGPGIYSDAEDRDVWVFDPEATASMFPAVV